MYLHKYRDMTAQTMIALKINIQLLNTGSVYHRTRHLVYIELIWIKEQISKILKLGVIRESNSLYVRPIVLVTPNGYLKLFIYYRKLNKRVIEDWYLLPHMQDQIDAITAFVTLDRQFEFDRMPFRYVNVPSIYQRVINMAVHYLKGDAAVVYNWVIRALVDT